MTGPISFKLSNVLHCLLKYGLVYTVRQERTVGNTWFNKNRGEKSLGNCKVGLMGSFREMGLGAMVTRSGFDTVDEWFNAISDLYDNGDNLYVYCVTLR